LFSRNSSVSSVCVCKEEPYLDCSLQESKFQPPHPFPDVMWSEHVIHVPTIVIEILKLLGHMKEIFRFLFYICRI